MKGIELESGLWIDGDDAPQRIDARLEKGEIDETTAERLRSFHDRGYTRFQLEQDDLVDALEGAFDRLWRSKPNDLLYAFDGPPRRMSRADESRERAHRYRIHDVHSHEDAALELYLLPELHRLVGEMLGEPVVAIQSLLFEYGSQQVLHRDPVVVPTGAPGHLVAAWIALEDIVEGSGELVYVPGSHRLPYYEFTPGGYMFDAAVMGEKEIEEATRWFEAQLEQRGLSREHFTAEKGEVLLWHASLHHGGGPVTDRSLTRKSLVIHYSTRQTYTKRSITVAEEVGDHEEMVVLETEKLIERGDIAGFANPAAGSKAPSE